MFTAAACDLAKVIIIMCSYNIEPRFNKELCINHMIECVETYDFDICAEYWEPTEIQRSFLADIRC